ncbi:MAG: C2 family cysteine protease [Actinomycetota bacterium]
MAFARADAELRTQARDYDLYAEQIGRVVSNVRWHAEALGEVWTGPRSRRFEIALREYAAALEPAIGALAHAAQALRRLAGSADETDGALRAEGVEIGLGQYDLVSAGRAGIASAEWAGACIACRNAFAGVENALRVAADARVDLGIFGALTAASLRALALGPDATLEDPEATKDRSGWWLWSDSDEEFDEKDRMTGLPLFKSISARNVVQGMIGDCYLAAAFAALAARPEWRKLIRDIVRDNGNGTYSVRFADRVVTVDADLYVAGTDPAYAKTSTEVRSKIYTEQMWFPIIEKAYAELHDGYDDIEGGHASRVFGELGLDAHHYDTDDMTTAQLTKRLYDDWKAGHPMTVSAELEPLGYDGDGKHAFSIIGVQKGAGGDLVVEIRNPWGQNDDLIERPRKGTDFGEVELTVDELRDHFYRVDVGGPDA